VAFMLVGLVTMLAVFMVCMLLVAFTGGRR